MRVPNDGLTDAVSTDGQHYGLADELGANQIPDQQQQQPAAPPDEAAVAAAAAKEEEDQRQRLQELLEWEPPGDKFVYNEETGMLETVGERVGDQRKAMRFGRGPGEVPVVVKKKDRRAKRPSRIASPLPLCAEGAHGTDGRKQREFIEDGATGDFYRLNDPGVWRKITRFFKAKVGNLVKKIWYTGICIPVPPPSSRASSRDVPLASLARPSVAARGGGGVCAGPRKGLHGLPESDLLPNLKLLQHVWHPHPGRSEHLFLVSIRV